MQHRLTGICMFSMSWPSPQLKRCCIDFQASGSARPRIVTIAATCAAMLPCCHSITHSIAVPAVDSCQLVYKSQETTRSGNTHFAPVDGIQWVHHRTAAGVHNACNPMTATPAPEMPLHSHYAAANGGGPLQLRQTIVPAFKNACIPTRCCWEDPMQQQQQQ
jgi:hypothetical protein